MEPLAGRRRQVGPSAPAALEVSGDDNSITNCDFHDKRSQRRATPTRQVVAERSPRRGFQVGSSIMFRPGWRQVGSRVASESAPAAASAQTGGWPLGSLGRKRFGLGGDCYNSQATVAQHLLGPASQQWSKLLPWAEIGSRLNKWPAEASSKLTQISPPAAELGARRSASSCCWAKVSRREVSLAKMRMFRGTTSRMEQASGAGRRWPEVARGTRLAGGARLWGESFGTQVASCLARRRMMATGGPPLVVVHDGGQLRNKWPAGGQDNEVANELDSWKVARR